MAHLLDKFRFCPACGSSRFDIHSEKSRKCAGCGFEYFLNPAAAVVAFIHNAEGKLLVERRKNNPAQGTLDLPGGFCDTCETVEQSLAREVKEETGLVVTGAKYLFSRPNTYLYSGMNIPTLDMFYTCIVAEPDNVTAADDAAECMWLSANEIHIEQFGLRSIQEGLRMYMEMWRRGDNGRGGI